MINDLLKLVQENAAKDIISNPNIPNELNNDAIGIVSDTIQNVFKNEISGGNIQNFAQLFQGNQSASNPLVNGIIGQAANNLASKLNIDSSISQSVASSLVPTIMQMLTKKTNDPNDNSFDLNTLVQQFGGNKDMIGALGSMLGGNKGGTGGLIGGLLGGMFKK